MKDIGYYAGFLSTEHQQLINKANGYKLTDLVSDVAVELYDTASFSPTDDESDEDLVSLIGSPTSDRDKLALIRGLCDRIELKLMEQAK
jgi:hypothetical protein